MSKVATSSDDCPSIANASQGEIESDGLTRPSNEMKSLPAVSFRWRLAKIQGARGLLRLRTSKTSSWVTAAGMCLVLWALALNIWPQAEAQKQGDRIDHLKAGDMIRIPAGVPHMARTLDEPMRAIIVYSAGERGFELVEED